MAVKRILLDLEIADFNVVELALRDYKVTLALDIEGGGVPAKIAAKRLPRVNNVIKAIESDRG